MPTTQPTTLDCLALYGHDAPIPQDNVTIRVRAMFSLKVRHMDGRTLTRMLQEQNLVIARIDGDGSVVVEDLFPA